MTLTPPSYCDNDDCEFCFGKPSWSDFDRASQYLDDLTWDAYEPDWMKPEPNEADEYELYLDSLLTPPHSEPSTTPIALRPCSAKRIKRFTRYDRRRQDHGTAAHQRGISPDDKEDVRLFKNRRDQLAWRDLEVELEPQEEERYIPWWDDFGLGLLNMAVGMGMFDDLVDELPDPFEPIGRLIHPEADYVDGFEDDLTRYGLRPYPSYYDSIFDWD